MAAVRLELPDVVHAFLSNEEDGMRIVTMLLITLLTGAAGIGAWIVLKSETPPVLPGKDTGPEKPVRKKAKWREAPYVILAPSKTLPDKQSAVSTPPPEPATARAEPPPVTPSAAPHPAPVAVKAPPKAPSPVVTGAPATTSSIAKIALETVIGPQGTSSEEARDAAREKRKLQLPYEANASSRSEALQKKQVLLAREQIRFRKAAPLSSGILKSDKTTISLAGLDALGADAKCTYASGKTWECGRWGKYALRRLIRGRSISCDVVEQVTENIVTASCGVAGVDINQWVIRRGWGRPANGENDKYDVAFKAAKSDKLGQWSLEADTKQN